MTGRAEVARLKQRLDATFQRVSGIDPSNLELRSDFARYLCVLVSGYLEKAVAEMVLEHARRSGSLSLQRFVEQNTRRFTNANSERLGNLLGSFNPEWRKTFESFLVDELKDAVNSIVDLRNSIGHGGSVGLTYQRISDYYARVQKVIDWIVDLCEPV